MHNVSSPDPDRPRHVAGPTFDPTTGLVHGEIELPGGLPPEEPTQDETDQQVLDLYHDEAERDSASHRYVAPTHGERDADPAYTGRRPGLDADDMVATLNAVEDARAVGDYAGAERILTQWEAAHPDPEPVVEDRGGEPSGFSGPAPVSDYGPHGEGAVLDAYLRDEQCGPPVRERDEAQR